MEKKRLRIKSNYKRDSYDAVIRLMYFDISLRTVKIV